MVVAGTHSGSGKTTVATGIMAALSRRGVAVAPAKVGPDFIDPGYHAAATGRPGRNLDEWICGSDAIAPLAARAAQGSEILVVEGVMGLFDGAVHEGPEASTASVARLLGAPILLVVDASSMGRTVAAVVAGMIGFDPSLDIAGVVLNKVGSDQHESILRAALAPLGLPVLGVLRRDARLSWRDRHLGLVPVVEARREIASSLDLLAGAVSSGIDLEAIMAIAQGAGSTSAAPLPETQPSGSLRVAVAGGKAFSFAYSDNLERFREAGAQLAFFDPLVDPALPEGCSALYAGGGFPESYAEELSANQPLRNEVRRAIGSGMVAWAECGGMAWLARSLDGVPMCGAIDAEVAMSRTLTLGYRRGRCLTDLPFAARGTDLVGHEHHYSSASPPGTAIEISGRAGNAPGGFGGPRLYAGYLHQHLGWDPRPAERFVALGAASQVP